MPEEGLGLCEAVQVVHEGVVGLEHILSCDAVNIQSCTGHNFALGLLLNSRSHSFGHLTYYFAQTSDQLLHAAQLT